MRVAHSCHACTAINGVVLPAWADKLGTVAKSVLSSQRGFRSRHDSHVRHNHALRHCSEADVTVLYMGYVLTAFSGLPVYLLSNFSLARSLAASAHEAILWGTN